MNVYIYVEPEYSNTLWCRQTLRAISDEAAKKRYPVRFLEPDNIFRDDFREFFDSDRKRLLLVLSTSVSMSDTLNEYFLSNNIHVIMINHQSVTTGINCSSIMVDYVDAMRSITEYLVGTSHSRMALYGINRNSSTDMIKDEYFCGMARREPDKYSQNDIYYNDSDLEECFSRLVPDLGKYNSFICANDIVAYSLIFNLRKRGYDVPRDFYVVSFGDSLLSQLGNPSLTTVSVDHGELGRQALFAYSYLQKASHSIYMTAKVAASLRIRKSTDCTVPYIKPMSYIRSLNTPQTDFYNDDESRKILALEDMLTKTDSLDMQIINGLLLGMTYVKMSAGLFISENVIFYRIKRLCKIAGVQSKESLSKLLSDYLSPVDIAEYLNSSAKESKEI